MLTLSPEQTSNSVPFTDPGSSIVRGLKAEGHYAERIASGYKSLTRAPRLENFASGFLKDGVVRGVPPVSPPDGTSRSISRTTTRQSSIGSRMNPNEDYFFK